MLFCVRFVCFCGALLLVAGGGGGRGEQEAKRLKPRARHLHVLHGSVGPRALLLVSKQRKYVTPCSCMCFARDRYAAAGVVVIVVNGVVVALVKVLSLVFWIGMKKSPDNKL